MRDTKYWGMDDCIGCQGKADKKITQYSIKNWIEFAKENSIPDDCELSHFAKEFDECERAILPFGMANYLQQIYEEVVDAFEYVCKKDVRAELKIIFEQAKAVCIENLDRLPEVSKANRKASEKLRKTLEGILHTKEVK